MAQSDEEELPPNRARIHSQSITSTYSVTIQRTGCYGRCRMHFGSIMNTRAYQWSVVGLCTIHGVLAVVMLLLEIESLRLPKSLKRSKLEVAGFGLECVSYGIVIYFSMEILLKLWVFGPELFYKHYLEMLDALVTYVTLSFNTFELVDTILSGNYIVEDPEKLSSRPKETTAKPRVLQKVVDAAGFLILLRLWRIVCIVNAVMQATTARLERTLMVKRKQHELTLLRILLLESALKFYQIRIPPPPLEVLPESSKNETSSSQKPK